jgi:hypothetical protein
MNAMLNRMRAMSDEQLQEVSEALDVEVDRRMERRIRKGYQRSTCMWDRVRGRIMAQRPQRSGLAA